MPDTISLRHLHLCLSLPSSTKRTEGRLTLRQSHLFILVCLAFYGPETSRQAEIADFELAIRVDEQIAGFQITVNDIGRVDILGKRIGKWVSLQV